MMAPSLNKDAPEYASHPQWCRLLTVDLNLPAWVPRITENSETRIRSIDGK